jgi:hypothetical protein
MVIRTCLIALALPICAIRLNCQILPYPKMLADCVLVYVTQQIRKLPKRDYVREEFQPDIFP